jgi:two-component system sensor histidine kinase HydH
VQSGNQLLYRVILPLLLAALPVVLLVSSVRTFEEIDTQRAIYLRHRVSLLAAQLEYLPAPASADAAWEALGDGEPYLTGLEIIARGSAADAPELAPLWLGHELFRTELLDATRPAVYRAYIPFHSGGEPRIARIDLNPAAADFLTVHARHNVILSSIGGVVMIALAVVAMWAIRRASESRLRQMEMEHLAHIGKMSAVLAHEIRNPLGTIKGFVQLAGEAADARTRGLLSPALAETERLETLVNGLLAYGGTPRPNPRTVPWNLIATRIAAQAMHTIGSRPITLCVREEGPAIDTDPDVLGQALLNLLRNAVEAIGAETPGEIEIRAVHQALRVVITVADNGPGIAPEARARLFEPFFTTKAFGSGLGLATTRKLIAALGGEFELRDRARGGTEAVIQLPAAAREPAEIG